MEQQSLKQAAQAALASYDAERDRLTAAGLNSKARYPLLMQFKAAADAAHAAHAEFAKDQIRRELDAIIRADAPARAAAARSRSPWKQAKFDAAR